MGTIVVFIGEKFAYFAFIGEIYLQIRLLLLHVKIY